MSFLDDIPDNNKSKNLLQGWECFIEILSVYFLIFPIGYQIFKYFESRGEKSN